MGFKFVILATDLALWALFAAIAGYAWRVAHHDTLRATWLKVLRDPAALSAALVLGLFVLLTLADSVHLRRVLPAKPGQPAGTVFYDTRTESLLDVLLARQLAMRESTYSEPLAAHALTKQNILRDGQSVRDYPRLAHGGAHLANPATERLPDIARRAATGAAAGLLLAALGGLGLAWAVRRQHGGTGAAWRAMLADRTDLPLRALWLTLLVVCLLGGAVLALMGHYHVFGTDRTGNDVLVQTLKSVRTAFVIGLLSTVATLPIAVTLGILAGWYRGWVDELVQYLYTLLSSVPNVLLIAACVLMVQVALDKHPEWLDTGAERADVKVFLLCVILGVTGWATLCRLVRAETLKLRELEFVQAATAFGVAPARIMSRHILPNVVHLVLITTVLSFSDLILYEAVLTYVGVGVDPSTSSFGGMINLARSEMSRDPVVWWSFAAAFTFMVALVLSANLFADGVRDAFDPRARALRPRLGLRKATGT
ncbi:ABC transporter permease [Aquabacterium sp. OR-4]|uniref:ABC transporter permease n=1 Tax=Aquabacterium sp. OR-4 TaxID=2978127 RepID=UPI0021B366EA|nr:ABC transporter permease [Aquabacterium sp. OR-4]MDT7835334.1 ABC transporter permease [Aquabacterium sp. OR-4]